MSKIEDVMKAEMADKSEIYRRVQAKNKPVRRFAPKALAAAAVAAALLLGGLSGYAIADENAEYKMASEYFAANSIPTDGLSRGELKKVYRDITLGTFSYEKTEEVMAKLSVEQQTLLLGGAAKPDEAQKAKSGYCVGYTDALETIVKVMSYSEGELLWEREISSEQQLYELILLPVPQGVYVCSKDSGGYAALLSPEGDVVWQRETSASEYQAAVVSDGGLLIFGARNSGDTHRLVTTRFSPSGEELDKSDSPMNCYFRVKAAVKTGDGYALGCWLADSREVKLFLIGSDGAPRESLSYSENGETYEITDIEAFGGSIYLSANKRETADFDAAYAEAADGSYCDEFGISLPEMTELFRSRYSAVLLRCSEQGVAEKVYGIASAQSGSLELEGDRLVWQLYSIEDALSVPMAINSRRIDLAAAVYALSFDESGALAGTTEVGETILWY